MPSSGQRCEAARLTFYVELISQEEEYGSTWSHRFGFSRLAAPIVAGTLAGITLPDKMDVNGQQLVLNGMALRKKVMFKVYVAGLYLPAKEQSGEKILAADGPRCTVMHFLRGVSAKQVNEAWYDGLEANTPGYSPN